MPDENSKKRKTVVSSPHNNYMLEFLEDEKNAIDFFENYSPSALAHLLDWKKLTKQSSMIYSNDHDACRADAIFSVPGNNRIERAEIFLVLEHKNGAYAGVTMQLMNYICKVLYESWTNRNCPLPGRNSASCVPTPLPLVVSHGASATWNPCQLSDFFWCKEPSWKDYILNMRPFHINLSNRKDEEITGSLSTRVVVQSLVLVSKKRFRQDFGLVVRHFAGHDLEGSNMHLLRRTLAYAQQTHNGINKEEFVETFDKVLGRRGKNMSLCFADELYNKGVEKGIKQGIKQGIEQGIEQGIDEGKAAIIIHCLEERFGTLNKSSIARIKVLANSQELDKISLKLISCQTLREVNELLKKSVKK